MKLEIEIPEEIMSEMTGGKIDPDIIITSLKMPVYQFIMDNYKNNHKIIEWFGKLLMPEFSGYLLNVGLTLNNLFQGDNNEKTSEG